MMLGYSKGCMLRTVVCTEYFVLTRVLEMLLLDWTAELACLMKKLGHTTN